MWSVIYDPYWFRFIVKQSVYLGICELYESQKHNKHIFNKLITSHSVRKTILLFRHSVGTLKIKRRLVWYFGQINQNQKCFISLFVYSSILLFLHKLHYYFLLIDAI